MTPLLAVLIALRFLAPQVAEVPPATPFSVVAAHDGAITDGYRLLINSAVTQDRMVTWLVNGEISFPVTGLALGTYGVAVEAYNVVGSTRSAMISLVVTTTAPAPGPPTNVRIVRIP